MSAYPAYLAKRLVQFALVVFIGVNLAFVITHASPIDPVEQSISAVTSFGSTAPEAIAAMRTSLQELYGLTGTLGEQYLTFWSRVLRGDFGPSLSAFPTPVSALIGRALPWTAGLLIVSTMITWVLGNLLGGLAGYYQRNRMLKLMGVVAMGVHPIPYYIVALLLLIVFGFLWPVLPITGGSAMNLQQGWNWPFVSSVLLHSILPALSLILIGLGSWFLGMRSLVSNVVTEDYVVYAEIAGLDSRRVLGSYVMRNALAPQVTGLAMSLGGIFNGAVITEKVFGYPGVGTLLVDAVYAGDYGLVLGVTTVSIIAVSVGVLVIDLLYPLIDPRVELR
ncbi:MULTISPECIES: ABC transporter permease [unclassified Chelatococcus]|jgi:peptide/nickel transport system permease protein|uniref:ABC transporter permease n=1 Tax=unclassified Chelatococcus TaxID=2638111 RepID=UPI001BCE6D9D|nr:MULTISPECIES: ABC transporter permease [unclassified Chelatococcus]CAH1671071.1 ABC transporter permease [Hyphomicrobiales bacterium]MBS7739125.1 ABC transporter permease [Chelatococcus sp. HY11]MBX3543560.1 ABC transporter permease [Chelatococcus sp.]MCO5076345.1 ABC transporter permease [Chelatococcus sp.]CAH1676735.1 ABC transporter permease [Hyphomicrobiales bacterium]